MREERGGRLEDGLLQVSVAAYSRFEAREDVGDEVERVDEKFGRRGGLHQVGAGKSSVSTSGEKAQATFMQSYRHGQKERCLLSTHIAQLLDDLGREFRTACLCERRPRLHLGDDHLETERSNVADSFIFRGGELHEAVDDGLDAGRADVRNQGRKTAVDHMDTVSGCKLPGAFEYTPRVSRLDCDALDFSVCVGDESKNLIDELMLCRVIERKSRLPRFDVEVVQRHEPLWAYIAAGRKCAGRGSRVFRGGGNQRMTGASSSASVGARSSAQGQ